MEQQIRREKQSMADVGHVPGVSKMGVFSICTAGSFCFAGFLVQINGSSTGKAAPGCIPSSTTLPRSTACQGGHGCQSGNHAKIFSIPAHLVSVIYGPDPYYIQGSTATEIQPALIAERTMDAVRDIVDKPRYVTYPPMEKQEHKIAFARRHIVWPVPVPSSPVLQIKDSLWLSWCHRLYPESVEELPATPSDPSNVVAPAPSKSVAKSRTACSRPPWVPSRRRA